MKLRPEEMNLLELAKRSKTPARTIRLYISMGVLPGPLRAGRNAAYGVEHLDCLARIRKLQREGLTLSQVREMLMAGDREPSPLVSVSWRQYMLSGDVIVSVREDIPPWRAYAIRQAIQQFNRLITPVEEQKEQEHE